MIRCMICGRELTDPKSKLLGVGKKCKKKIKAQQLQEAERIRGLGFTGIIIDEHHIQLEIGDEYFAPLDQHGKEIEKNG